MNNEQVFSAANKLESYSVKIGTIDLVVDTIISLEMCYKNNTPKVTGKLLIDDLYSLNLLVDWTTIDIEINYTDIKSQLMTKKFKPVLIEEFEHSNYKKAIQINLQDMFSYKLEHSFLSKGFSGTVSEALTAYMTKLELTETLTEFTETELIENFVVPKNVNNLDFFIEKFSQQGYYFFQNRESVLLKSLSDLSIDSLEIKEDLFTNDTDNKYYKNRIIASKVNFNDRKSIGDKKRTVMFNNESKTIIYNNLNDKSEFSLNDNLSEIQNTDGFEEITQQHLSENDHNKKIRDSLIKQNQLEIVVNGFSENKVNQVFNIFLKGNISTSETQILGNLTVSGKYISNIIIDKIVGDSFIQKIYLERSDSQAIT